MENNDEEKLRKIVKRRKIYQFLAITQIIVFMAFVLFAVYEVIFVDHTPRGVTLYESEIMVFNNKFLKYEGSLKGAQVKALINDVNKNNLSNPNSKVSINGNENPTYDGINTRSEYTIKAEYKGGRVSNIILKEE